MAYDISFLHITSSFDCKAGIIRVQVSAPILPKFVPTIEKNFETNLMVLPQALSS